MSEAEFALLEERARGAGMRLGEWVREALLSAPVEPVAGSGVDSGEIAYYAFDHLGSATECDSLRCGKTDGLLGRTRARWSGDRHASPQVSWA